MKYIPTIGLEVHVQLNTKTKLFCGCKTSFGDEPNANTCPVCLGLPGALPVFNEAVLEKAIRAAMALNCDIHLFHKFDRKNYFYPDLPKGYQISQFDKPYCTQGSIQISKENGTSKSIGVTRIHIEEDAGKLVHSASEEENASFIDLNRAGTPLIEIVSEPDLDDPEEAYLYLSKLKEMMEYLDVSDCNMEQGSLRCDANISVRPDGTNTLGIRAEIKNLNSFKNVRAAIEYEIERQIDLIESGGTVVQETRLYNADEGVTKSMRGKEETHDYRYFNDPDLVPVEMTQALINKIRESLPELAAAKKDRYKSEYRLSEYDADVLTQDPAIASYFENLVKAGAPAKKAANWILSEVLAVADNRPPAEVVSSDSLAELINEIEKGKISGKIAKQVFQELLNSDQSVNEIIESKGLKQISDSSEIEAIVDQVIADNTESVESYKAGKQKAIGFLVGQVMKVTQGKANPAMVNKILKEKLSS